MRLPVPLGTRPVGVPSFGPQTALYAILGRSRAICRARLAQSTTTGMSLGTRKVQGECALFCGLSQPECRISECFPVEIPAERSVLTTRGQQLEVRPVLWVTAPSFGRETGACKISTT